MMNKIFSYSFQDFFLPWHCFTTLTHTSIKKYKKIANINPSSGVNNEYVGLDNCQHLPNLMCSFLWFWPRAVLFSGAQLFSLFTCNFPWVRFLWIMVCRAKSGDFGQGGSGVLVPRGALKKSWGQGELDLLLKVLELLGSVYTRRVAFTNAVVCIATQWVASQHHDAGIDHWSIPASWCCDATHCVAMQTTALVKATRLV